MILHITHHVLRLSLVVLLAACTATPQVTRTPVSIHIADASEHIAVLNQVIAHYARDHEWINFTVDPLPATDAIAGVRAGQIDIAVLPDAPDQSNGTLWLSGWAYEALAVIVHPDNPTTNLSLVQLRDLYQGRTFDWTPYGGVGDVIPVSREAGAFARTTFEGHVMNNRAVTLNAVLKPSAQDVLDFVAQTPGAIGYVSLSKVNARVKVLSIEGASSTPETAASGKYVLSSPIYLIAKAEPAGDLREFVGWLLGDEGQKLIESMGLGRVTAAR